MKLIDKDALVAEIEKLIDEIYAGRPFDSLSSEQQTALWYIKSIMSSVNTIEVKEVQEEPVSDDLEEAAENYAATDKVLPNGKVMINFQAEKAFRHGAKWYKKHPWKSADGDDLPEYDREVIVLVKYSTQRNIHDEEYPTYRVGFGHRPNPDGWDGKNIDTNEVTHYTPKLYDKGGWNAPDIAYWLDVELPKEIEL